MTLAMDKQRFAKLLRKAAICAVAALVAALVLELLQMISEPKVHMVSRDESSGITALNMDTALLKFSAHQNGAIIVAGRRAQITFDLPEAMTMDKILVSSDRIEGDYVVRVLYAAPGSELSVDQSTEMSANAAQGTIILDIPKGDYDKLGVQVSGNLAVTAIEVSDTDDIPMIALPSAIIKKRVAKLAIFLFVVFLVLMYLGFWKHLADLPERAVKRIRAIRAARGDALKNLLIFLGMGVLGYLLARLLILYYLKAEVNRITHVFCVSFAVSVGCLFTFRKTLGKKPEVFFVILVVLSGSLMSFFAPNSSSVSWDDGFHSGNAVNYSYFGHECLTEQDIKSITDHSHVEYDLSKLDQWHAEQDALYQRGTVIIGDVPMDIHYYWSLTHGFGMFLGRILGVPYWMVWGLGRLAGLLTYALVGYFAIRRLHSGKMILASVLLIPEAVFLASQFSYDPAVTSFLALGMSYCFAEWQEMDKKITSRNALIMVGALLLGCLVKAIYFPLFLIPLFLPKEKFESNIQRRRFIILCLSAMVAIILYFMIPFLTGSGGGDVRGGEEVNAIEQVSFILHNPLQYTQILLQFLRGYLGPESSAGLLSFFAYLGFAPLTSFYLGLMIAVCFTDRSERELKLTDSHWARILSLFFLFGTMCLVATALYVDFTPVGLDTINGCQSRYLYPVIFPAMVLLGSGRIVNRTNRTLYNGIMLSAMGYINFVSVLATCLGKYA